MSKFKIRRDKWRGWYIHEEGTHQYIYENGGYKAYDGLNGLVFKTRKKAREALNKYLEALNKYLSPFKIAQNGIGWYIEQVGTNNYLHSDGKVYDWNNEDGKVNVYFKSESEAQAVLDKFIGKRKPKIKKPKLAPSAKKKVNDIVVKLTATLKNLEAALKVLTNHLERE